MLEIAMQCGILGATARTFSAVSLKAAKTQYKVNEVLRALAINRTGSVGEFSQRVRIEFWRWWSDASIINYK